jgi:hypothetical protein
MGAFDWAVLVRGVGCSRLKGIASILKELNILVGDILGETMME